MQEDNSDRLNLSNEQEKKYKYRIRIYRSKMHKCERCLKYNIEKMKEEDNLSEKVCDNCKSIIKALN